MNQKLIVIDPFCFRQFEDKAPSQILYDRQEFENKINEIYNKANLKDGYAPFCKHLFVENFTQTPNYTMKITKENEHLLKSEYRARTEKELPVLIRYFQRANIELKQAKFLDIILYSREQIIKENLAMGNEAIPGEYDYGIVSVKPQDIDSEIPMNPITIMRNSLGVQEGGSGINIDREKYTHSVQFWNEHALIE